MMLKRITFACIFFGCLGHLGCSELEELEDYDVGCHCQALSNADWKDDMYSDELRNEREIWTTSDEECRALVGSLVGTWIGLGDNSDRRMILSKDGQFVIQERGKKSWLKRDEGQYWIEYALFQGMLRTELHMTSPILDDYVVRYRFENEVLHLEEPTDGEPSMRFVLE